MFRRSEELETPSGMPEWATVQCIEPSPFDAGTAYVVAHNYRLDDPKPYLPKGASGVAVRTLAELPFSVESWPN